MAVTPRSTTISVPNNRKAEATIKKNKGGRPIKRIEPFNAICCQVPWAIFCAALRNSPSSKYQSGIVRK
jgi:hypothetical protein